jgi:hypothetical protein
MLRFSDGVEFNTEGKLRIEERFDGLYVVGDGMLIPISSQAEGNVLIADDLRKQIAKLDDDIEVAANDPIKEEDCTADLYRKRRHLQAQLELVDRI